LLRIHELFPNAEFKRKLITRIENGSVFVLNVEELIDHGGFIRASTPIIPDLRNRSVVGKRSADSRVGRHVGRPEGIANEFRIGTIEEFRIISENGERDINTRPKEPHIDFTSSGHLVTSVDLVYCVVELGSNVGVEEIGVELEEEVVGCGGIEGGEDVPSATTLFVVSGAGAACGCNIFESETRVDCKAEFCCASTGLSISPTALLDGSPMRREV